MVPFQKKEKRKEKEKENWANTEIQDGKSVYMMSRFLRKDWDYWKVWKSWTLKQEVGYSKTKGILHNNLYILEEWSSMFWIYFSNY